MPTLLASHTKHGKRRLLTLLFPEKMEAEAPESSRWRWPELRVGPSAIQGFGLFPRMTGALSWEKLERPVAMPYLGRETEVESHTQARVLRSVLCGNFDTVLREQLYTLEDHEWVQDGLYVVQMSHAEVKERGSSLTIVSDPQTLLIQVVVSPDFGASGIFSFDEGDELVCYMLAEETRELLHLPPHIFTLLSRHADDEHADRNVSLLSSSL